MWRNLKIKRLLTIIIHKCRLWIILKYIKCKLWIILKCISFELFKQVNILKLNKYFLGFLKIIYVLNLIIINEIELTTIHVFGMLRVTLVFI